ncbi:hypothetical protein [Bartonella tribocorum]|uniref:Uncharacterized protein n=1 Tax=Bartonella tribocorum (strain DSM 28219 / CCUG 45778 / CIP 105476 / IBS 506) TaxID=382640 RepID=A9IW57_BART1|nr:hypothetical protein [Bartonella tribocorum]CAK01886.1 hypothetical protein BT_1539a [Bartonella tribocorum CIP 105476]CDO49137.1 hypothetical protein BM1374166_01468 [Bartonella tribocorum]
MLFLYFYCKKENLLPLTTWIFLSSLGVFLTSTLEMRAYLIKQSHTSNLIKTNKLYSQNKYDQLNVTTTENKKPVTFHTESIFMKIFQKILTLNLFLIKIPAIDTRLRNFQMQYFSNKRAPPNEQT